VQANESAFEFMAVHVVHVGHLGGSVVMRVFMAICAAIVSLLAHGQISIPTVQPPQVQFFDEDADWGVEPTSSPRRSQYHARTPTARTFPTAAEYLDMVPLALKVKEGRACRC